jgi:hypothetical protein
MDKINKYKQYVKEREEASKANENNQTKAIKKQIEKIKAIREKNKNIGEKRRKVLNKTYNDIYEKKTENNVEETKLLKEEIKRLQTEEDACLANLNKTRDRLVTFTTADKYGNIQKGYLGFSNKKRKSSHKPTIKSTPLDKSNEV